MTPTANHGDATITVTAESGTILTYTITVTRAAPDTTTTVTTLAVNEVILPEVAQAMADSTVSAIAQRVERTGARLGNEARTFTLGGQRGLAGSLAAHGEAVADGTLNLKDMLGDSEFVLPLNAADNGASGGGLVFWGAGDYRCLDGEDGAVNWDGALVSAHLGVDARLGADLLAGVAVSRSRIDLDYTNTGDGDYESDLTSVHPYLGWTAGRLDLWATAGYGVWAPTCWPGWRCPGAGSIWTTPTPATAIMSRTSPASIPTLAGPPGGWICGPPPATASGRRPAGRGGGVPEPDRSGLHQHRRRRL